MLSKQQHTVYWFVVRFCMQHDAAPSIEEIGAGLPFALTRDEIIDALWFLENNGSIRPAANTARKLSHADEETLRMVIDTRDDSAAEAK